MRDALCHSFVNIEVSPVGSSVVRSPSCQLRLSSALSDTQSRIWGSYGIDRWDCRRFSHHNLSWYPFCSRDPINADSTRKISDPQVLIGKKSLELTPRALESSRLRESIEDGVASHDTNGRLDLHTVSPVSGHQYAFTHSNTVGILGGMAALATVDFLRKVVAATPRESDIIPFLVCSDPHVTQKVAPVWRATDESHPCASKLQDVDESSPLSALLEKRRFLERAGARLIVMPCHASHMFYDQLTQDCTVPFLHIGDCVVDELNAANLRPIEAGSKVKIGVLGTEATLGAGFYQQKLIEQGFEVALPDKATLEHAVVPGIRALHRGDMEGARNLLRIAVQLLIVNAVNMVVLACHDTPTAFAPDDPLLRKCIDPTDALAWATVQWAQAAKAARK